MVEDAKLLAPASVTVTMSGCQLTMAPTLRLRHRLWHASAEDDQIS